MNKFNHLLFLIACLCLSSFLQAQTIYLKTEHYPPYNIDLSLNDSGEKGIGGASAEIVLEMIRRSGYAHKLELLPWKRAYRLAETEVYTGVFSTTRTEARENVFKWVGPIADNNYVLFTTQERNIFLESIDTAKKYSVGAYQGSAGEGLMREAKIPIELVPRDHLNALKLQRNRIDLWISGNLYGPYLAKQYGVTNLKEVYTVRKAQMYVAFNKNTPDIVINKLNDVLQTMREEGFLKAVYDRYK